MQSSPPGRPFWQPVQKGGVLGRPGPEGEMAGGSAGWGASRAEDTAGGGGAEGGAGRKAWGR